MRVMLWALFLLAFWVSPSWAAKPCTDGTDCYCDKVAPGGSLADAQLLLCEDFDFPGLYSNVGFGNGPPNYGPIYDHTGWSGGTSRGYNSYLNRKYGNGLSNMIWAGGTPTNPTLGVTCGESLCHGLKVWHPTNLWNANAYQPNAAFHFASAHFSAEIGTITPPTNAVGGSSGVFDGNAILAYRYQPIGGNNNGTVMTALNYWTPTRHLGVTYALALPNNFITSGLASREGNSFLKFTEFQRTDNGLYQEGLAGFGYAGTNGALSPQFPFYSFLFVPQNCAMTTASIVVTKGSYNCVPGGAFQWFGDTSYNQLTHWPIGTWGCIRADIDFSTVTNGRIRMWVQTTVLTTETLVVDISGINGNGIGQMTNGWSGLMFNGWANTYDGPGPPAQVTFRYEDNYHVRNGAPVSCAQIGFTGGSGGGGDLTPPAAPVNLHIN